MNDARRMVRRVWGGLPGRFRFVHVDDLGVMTDFVQGAAIQGTHKGCPYSLKCIGGAYW